ncbi:BTAD domain-containing putative transcriptional regulator [Phytohabitans sp. LJ34]|uniref:AfsR/SARP family transcriptional regulator n=1 Tax=Phytohabitans sp. LJ34 TaxID=3452217 RepID=UPI003F8A319D
MDDDVGMDVDFRILGPVELRVGGRPVRLASPKVRVLAARLLLDAGRPVPIHELAAMLWGEDQPERPRRAVQLYAARLRSALAAVPDRQIMRTVSGAYVVDVPPEVIDLGRFRAHMREAGRAAEREDRESEAASIAAALAEWRGEPLADVESDQLRAWAVASLRDEWFQALARRIDLDLDRRATAEVIGEVRELTGRYPLHERFWEQLMQALDAAGRRAEALDAYHAARRRLSEELGIEPGEELRRLHRRILDGRSGNGDAPAPAIYEPPVPRQLPPDVPGFVGRVEELARLDRLADDPAQPRTVVVSGAPGVGKSTLAVRWARRVSDRFLDGQLWVDLRGNASGEPATPEYALARSLRALGVPGDRIPSDREEQAAMYRSLLDGRRMLVVLDNAGSAEQVMPLLPSGPGCVAVVTSRSQLTGLVVAGAQPMTLDLLSPAESRQLLAGRIGAHRTEAEPAATDEIISRCARLPLALAIVAARAATHPGFALGAFARELRTLDAFTTGSPATDVRAVFSSSMRAVSSAAARLFRLLGLHPGPTVSVAAAASLAGVPVPLAGRLVAELTRAHLLAEPEPGRYAMHDLLHAWAVELAQAEPPGERRAPLERMLDHYLHSAMTAVGVYRRLLVPIDVARPCSGAVVTDVADPELAAAWYTVEHPVLIAAVEVAVAHGFERHAWQLAWVVGGFLDRHRHVHDIERISQSALAAAARLGDPVAEAHTLGGLATAMALSNRYDEALAVLIRAAALFADLGDTVSQAGVYVSLAQAYGRLGRDAEAFDWSGRAVALYQEAGHDLGYANALNAVAWFAAKLGRHRETLRYGRQAMRMLRALGDVRGQAGMLDTLGIAHHHLGEWQLAESCFQQAVVMFERLEMPYHVVDTLVHLGDCNAAAGDTDAARAAWRRALAAAGSQEHEEVERVRAALAQRSPAPAQR